MIKAFSGENRWLSNFWPATVTLDGVQYPSVENAYQAAKFAPRNRGQFTTCSAPEAKKFGKVLGKPGPTWEQDKLSVMEGLIKQKFAAGTELAAKLLATGAEELIEGNWWGDTFWGISHGKGQNHLGKIIMAQRQRLQHEQSELQGNIQPTPDQEGTS